MKKICTYVGNISHYTVVTVAWHSQQLVAVNEGDSENINGGPMMVVKWFLNMKPYNQWCNFNAHHT